MAATTTPAAAATATARAATADFRTMVPTAVPGGGGGGGSGNAGGTYFGGGSGANGEIVITYTQQAVPEPSTIALLCAGAVGLLAIAWRHKRSLALNCAALRVVGMTFKASPDLLPLGPILGFTLVGSQGVFYHCVSALKRKKKLPYL